MLIIKNIFVNLIGKLLASKNFVVILSGPVIVFIIYYYQTVFLCFYLKTTFNLHSKRLPWYGNFLPVSLAVVLNLLNVISLSTPTKCKIYAEGILQQQDFNYNLIGTHKLLI